MTDVTPAGRSLSGRAETQEPVAAKAPRPVLPVEEARANLSRTLNELDDRLSLKRSLARHPVAWAVGTGVAVLAIAGTLVLAFRSHD